MRGLAQNEQPVFFKMLIGQEELKDEYNNVTGEMIPIYSGLKSAMLSVSPNKGTSETEQFGTFAEYDRTMVTSDTKCPIDEQSVLWVDNADTDDAYNYIVKKRAPWKNSISFAIQQVTVSQYQEKKKEIAELLEKKKQFDAMRITLVSNDAEDNTQPEQQVD